MDLKLNCVISRLDDVSNSHSDDPAIVFKERVTTYKELISLSDRYANWLSTIGIKPLDRILVDLPRSDLQIIIQIAILRIGAVYVPRNYDIKNINQVLDDCSICMTIGDTHVSPTKSAYINIHDIPKGFLIGGNPTPQKIKRSSDHPVVILTTSGTTGKPKYLLLPSRSHINLLTKNWYCSFDNSTRILYYSPASFDAATVEVWSALLNGGTIIVSQLRQFDVGSMHDEVKRHKINTLWLTSAVFSNIVNYRIEFFNELRYVMTGGDTVSANDIRKFKKIYPNIVVVNCWGPAENGTFSTCAKFEQNTLIEDPLQIGKPINGINVYLISDEGSIITEPGTTGRIHVNGKGIFLGYVNSHGIELPTINHKSVPEPLFDTGDYGAYSQNYEIQFFGRRDDLVKIGGKRVYLNNLCEKLVAELDLEYCFAHSVGEASGKMVDLFIVGGNNQSAKSNWDEYHNEVYEKELSRDYPQAMFAGWIDPTTGSNIDQGIMEQWQGEYIQRVNWLKRTSFIDVGCGTGMALSGLENIRKYQGIDASKFAINYLKKKYKEEHYNFTNTEANAFFEDSPPLSYEVILINSVINYFNNKCLVKNLLTSIHNVVNYKYLYLGDLINYELMAAKPNNNKKHASIIGDQNLCELTFTFNEIYSLLRTALGEIKLIFMPKLCANMNAVFSSRYDVVVHFDDQSEHVDITQIKLQEVNFDDITDNVIIEIGSYDYYLQILDDIRELIRKFSLLGLNACPFFCSLHNNKVSIAVSSNPYNLISNTDMLDLKLDPVCFDPKLSNRLRDSARSIFNGICAIRKIHLLYYLPSTTRGKLDRYFLKQFTDESKAKQGITVEAKVCQLLRINTKDLDSTLHELGITSLDAMRIALHLEHEFLIPLSTKNIFELGTASKIINYIIKTMKESCN